LRELEFNAEHGVRNRERRRWLDDWSEGITAPFRPPISATLASNTTGSMEFGAEEAGLQCCIRASEKGLEMIENLRREQP
jgi:hypothetical protein